MPWEQFISTWESKGIQRRLLRVALTTIKEPAQVTEEYSAVVVPVQVPRPMPLKQMDSTLTLEALLLAIAKVVVPQTAFSQQRLIQAGHKTAI